jgi:hypothetical protein
MRETSLQDLQVVFALPRTKIRSLMHSSIQRCEPEIKIAAASCGNDFG